MFSHVGASFQLALAFDQMKSCRHKRHRHLILSWFRAENIPQILLRRFFEEGSFSQWEKGTKTAKAEARRLRPSFHSAHHRLSATQHPLVRHLLSSWPSPRIRERQVSHPSLAQRVIHGRRSVADMENEILEAILTGKSIRLRCDSHAHYRCRGPHRQYNPLPHWNRDRMPLTLAIAAIVAVLLAVYLVVAMLAPEWFG